MHYFRQSNNKIEMITFAVRQLIAKCPGPVFNRSAALYLNQKLRPYIDSGELDFLENKRWMVTVSDAPRTLCIQLEGRRLTVSSSRGQPDLEFKGPVASFITLALKEEDPDSLFFSRRLMISGDTALGLEIKNFIDRLPLEAVLNRPLLSILRQVNSAFNVPQTEHCEQSA
jgi:predicted lipid carrier protein YhbT